jgi:hypothetical protein
MTKEKIKIETEKVTERINALEYVKDPNPVPVHLHDEVILDMLKEYKDRLDYLRSSKEFMVNFEGGGWNTCYGITKEDAFDNAVLEYGASVHTQVRSVSLATSEGIKAAMSLFY